LFPLISSFDGPLHVMLNEFSKLEDSYTDILSAYKDRDIKGKNALDLIKSLEEKYLTIKGLVGGYQQYLSADSMVKEVLTNYFKDKILIIPI